MSYRFILASQSTGRLKVLSSAGIPAYPFASEVDEDQVRSLLPNDFSPAEIVTSLAVAKAHRVLRVIARFHHPDSPYGASSAHTPFLDAPIEKNDYLHTQQLVSELPANAEILIVGGDSMLLNQGKLTGKPHEASRALAQITQLSGNSPVLFSGHCLLKIRLGDLWESNLEGPMPDLFANLYGPDSGLSLSPEEAPLSLGNYRHFGGLTQICGTSRSTVHFDQISPEEAAAYVATGEPLEVAGGFTIDGLGGPFIKGITGDYHGIVGISLPLLRLMGNNVGIFWPNLWDR